MRPDTSRGKAEEDDIQIVDATKSMQFQLCGLGESCSITQGQPSEARHMLLRRQALELALYTFKYVDGIEYVTVFLPPPPGPDAQASAVFLKRGDVKDQLSKPLSKTLAPGAPSIGQIPAKELQTLNGVTGSRLYNFQYTQAQDLSAARWTRSSPERPSERRRPAARPREGAARPSRLVAPSRADRRRPDRRRAVALPSPPPCVATTGSRRTA